MPFGWTPSPISSTTPEQHAPLFKRAFNGGVNTIRIRARMHNIHLALFLIFTNPLLRFEDFTVEMIRFIVALVILTVVRGLRCSGDRPIPGQQCKFRVSVTAIQRDVRQESNSRDSSP